MLDVTQGLILQASDHLKVVIELPGVALRCFTYTCPRRTLIGTPAARVAITKASSGPGTENHSHDQSE